MLRGFYVIFLAMTTGFILSGITANLYALLSRKSDDGRRGDSQTNSGQSGGGQSQAPRKLADIGIMIVAGPTMLLHSQYKAVREKRISMTVFWLAAAVAAYWSLVIGLISLRIIFAL